MKNQINPIFYVVGWLVMTLSLVGWWLVYGLRQLEKLARLENSLPAQLLQQQRMLHWEGMTLFALLVIGGGALLFYALQERRRSQHVREFFATLTHELKTPLASLRLQAESLQEDLAEGMHSSEKLIERLVRDTVRLELQLENALFLASVRSRSPLHLEEISIWEMTNRLKVQWPELDVLIPKNLKVRADTRALEGILKNLFQNARIHGKAGVITLRADVADHGGNKLRISIRDDGAGFQGDKSKLGKLFSRPTARSGSGVGLYLAQNLAKQMNGKLIFSDSRRREPGFDVDLWLDRGADL